MNSFASKTSHIDYVLSCAQLLGDLQSSDVFIPTYHGRPARMGDVVSADVLAAWIAEHPGRLSRLDDDASDPMAFRWTPEAGESNVIKVFESEKSATQNDERLAAIADNLPIGLFEVIPRVDSSGRLRIYKNISGISLEHLLVENFYPTPKNYEIIRLFTKHLQILRDKIKERYGSENVREIHEDWNFDMITPDLHLEIRPPEQESFEIWIHGDNVLFDSVTKTFWIINPG